LQKYGQIDILVSNAAANPSNDAIVSMSEKALDKLWEINVKASIQIVQVNWNVYWRIVGSCKKAFYVISWIICMNLTVWKVLELIFLQAAAPFLSDGSSVIFVTSIAAFNPGKYNFEIPLSPSLLFLFNGVVRSI
jgi:NAD(P)-dependent dehydrogenase (short-subunit alcohol dehydrogenase family)